MTSFSPTVPERETMETTKISASNGNGEDNEAGVEAITASTSYIFPWVLNAAVQLDVFEIIAKAGDGARLSPSEIASRLPTNGRGEEAAAPLDSMLRLLASYSLLTCSTSENADGDAIERRYGLAPSGKFFARDESGMSLAKLQQLGNHQAETMELGHHSKDAVLGGGVLFERLYGKSFYEYMNSSPEHGKMFHDAMRAHSVFILDKVLETYHGFEGISSIVNVAGGDGATLEMIISKHPSIRGINYDLPEVIQNAPPCEGIEHIGGDMFVEVPQGDTILLKFILHNWSDEKCIQVLRNCHKALPKNKMGKVIALECMLPEVPRADVHSKFASQMDNMMLILFGAKQRTKHEFEYIAKEAGFAELKVVCYVRGLWVMEFIKPN